MTPFYLNVCVHFFYIIMILLVLPESLSTEARSILRKNAKLASDAQKRQDTIQREWENETPAPADVGNPFEASAAEGGIGDGGRPSWSRRFSVGVVGGPAQEQSKRSKKIRGWLRRTFRKGTAFLQPLEVFMPKEGEDGKTDWTMTVTGAALFMMSLLYVSGSQSSVVTLS